MIEWIIAGATGGSLLLALGAAVYAQRRGRIALHEAGERLGLDTIRTTGSLPRLEGDLDGIPVTIGKSHFPDDNHVHLGVEPKGLPPEVSLVMAGPIRKRERLEALPIAERLRERCKVDTTDEDILEAMLTHETATEALWSLLVAFVHVRIEAGTVYLRLSELTETDSIVESVQLAVEHARRMEDAFEERPIVSR